MRYSILSAASSLLLLASTITAQSPTALDLKPIQTLDCYQNVDPLTKIGNYTFATDGWCQKQCGRQNLPVMALTGGSICYCGTTIPPRDQIVSEDNCNFPCAGYDELDCGGIGYWQVYLTGLVAEVSVAPNGSDSSSSSSSSTSSTMTPPAVVTQAGQTVVVTAASSPSATPGPNKVGIAAGIVVGFVAISALAGGLIFFLKQRRKRAIEEEHRRLEAAAAAEKVETSSTHTDQRLDPSNIFSHRRESIGSIADEMDFSRRILQVRNPDRFSTNSGA